MRYLTTPPTDERLGVYVAHRIGVMVNPLMGNRVDRRWPYVAVDNACFSRPDRFDVDEFLGYVAGVVGAHDHVLFAVAPDVVADADATWRRSEPVLPLLRQAGARAALVAQDGFDAGAVDWDAFEVLFLGGSTRWKVSLDAQRATAEALRRGKPVHMGRVNSERRLALAAAWGCTSADGTYLAFGPDANLPKLARWLWRVRTQPAQLPIRF